MKIGNLKLLTSSNRTINFKRACMMLNYDNTRLQFQRIVQLSTSTNTRFAWVMKIRVLIMWNIVG